MRGQRVGKQGGAGSARRPVTPGRRGACALAEVMTPRGSLSPAVKDWKMAPGRSVPSGPHSEPGSQRTRLRN